MKYKVLAVLMAGGLATSALGQGILANNTANTGGLGATNNGQVFIDGVIFDGNQFNLGVVLSGGANAGSLAPIGIGTFTAATDPKTYTGDSTGHFALGSGVMNVPGLASGAQTATIHMDVWYDGVGGLFPSFAAASAAANGKVASVTWVNKVGDPTAGPPIPPQAFDQMPSINLVTSVVPEPSVFALAGLSAAALMIFRRRN